MPQVSVIIPTYNRPRYLQRALESVLCQSFEDYEIIVVQNGPARYGGTLVRKLKRQRGGIRFCHVRRADPANARNVGLQLAEGEYIAFLDDDDEWRPEKLRMQVRVMNKKKGVGLVACSLKICDDTGSEVRKTMKLAGELSLKTLLTKGCVIGSLSSVLIRRSLMAQVGGFDSRFQIANDYDLYLRLAQKTKLWLMPHRLVNVYQHGQNLSHNAVQSRREVVAVLKKLISSRMKWKGISDRMIKSALETWQYLLKYVVSISNCAGPCGKRRNAAQEIRRLRSVLKFDPDNAVFRHRLALAYHRAGKTKEAKAQARAGFDLARACWL